MRTMSNASCELGYWGPVTATIDWCEENYVWSHFIAEFWNTLYSFRYLLAAGDLQLSSLAIFFAGIYGWSIALVDGLETRFQISQLLVAGVGIGSACFHCTLRHVEQQCDETPMVLTQLNWFHELFADTWEENSFLSAAMPVLLVLYGVGFALLHNSYRWTTGFQVHFAVWSLVNLARCAYVSREKGVEPATVLLKRAVIAAGLAVSFWMTDFHFCSHLQSDKVPNPEGHAWWHVMIAYAILQCTSFSIYRRCIHQQVPVTIAMKGPFGIWPIVRVVRQTGSNNKKHAVIDDTTAQKHPALGRRPRRTLVFNDLSQASASPQQRSTPGFQRDLEKKT